MSHAVLTQGFSFGSVVSSAFSILFRNLIPFLFFALLITVPSLLYDLYAPPPTTERGALMQQFLSNIIAFICSTVLTATLVYGTVQELRGQHASLGASIGRGFSVLLPAIGVGIVVGLGVALGIVLLIVPGLILMTMWWVAVPVTVVERPGVFASIGRSAELTRGFRWPIFGIVILFLVVSVVILFLLGVLLGPMLVRGTLGLTTFYVIVWVVAAIISAITSVLAGVGYFALRVEKEGADIDQLATVFD